MCYISTKFHKICTPALQHCAATTLQQQKFKLVLWSVLTVQSKTAANLCSCRIFLVCRISECWNSTTSDVDSEHVQWTVSSVQCPDSDVVTSWQLQCAVSSSVSVTMFMMSYDVSTHWPTPGHHSSRHCIPVCFHVKFDEFTSASVISTFLSVNV